MAERKNELFQFSSREKSGIVLLLLVNLLIYYAPDLYYHFAGDKYIGKEIIVTPIAHNKMKEEDNKEMTRDSSKNYRNSSTATRYFEFDPNHCTDEQWRELGVSDKTIHTIRNYLSKGGKFKKPDDLQKIWGISKKLSLSLIPFVRINEEPQKKLENRGTTNSSQQEVSKIIDINTADSILLESLPGIGPALSSRIIRYRVKLGGFYDVSQVGEVWGLADSLFQKIKNRLSLSGELKKINLNTADFRQFSSHPYIGYQSAKLIINYRKQHGNFNSLDDVQNIVAMDEKTFNRMRHYLTIN